MELHWLELFQLLHKLGLDLRVKLREMSPKFYHFEGLSDKDFADFDALMTCHDLAGEFLIQELKSVVIDGDRNKNLTSRYYGALVLRHLHHKVLRKKLQDFLSLPQEQQHLDIGATLLAQWCQPQENIGIGDIHKHIDKLVEDVRNHLKQTDPQHPVLKQDIEYRNISDDCWDRFKCKAILEAIKHILYTRHGFRGNSDEYYNPDNSFINKVFEHQTGIPITLCILFESVARRLGVICKPVNTPNHFLLKWHHKESDRSQEVELYIDAFNQGKFLQASDLPSALGIIGLQLDTDAMINVATSEVMQRMTRNLIAICHGDVGEDHTMTMLQDVLEFYLLLKPEDVESRMLQARVHLHLRINLEEVIESLEQMALLDSTRSQLAHNIQRIAQREFKQLQDEMENKQQKAGKKRCENKTVKFAIGMIMHHLRYGYKCVIYGWDSKCEATRDWIIQMGVHKLPGKDQQPFYNVLGADGTMRYAAQENLRCMSEPCFIDHRVIGRYFDSFDGHRFIPNAEKEREYPDDAEFVSKYIKDNYKMDDDD